MINNPGPGVLSYISHIDMCRPKGYGKRVHTLPILVWNRVWFWSEIRKCMNVIIEYDEKNHVMWLRWTAACLSAPRNIS